MTADDKTLGFKGFVALSGRPWNSLCEVAPRAVCGEG